MDYLIGHLVGDYLLQTHKMGIHKKDKDLDGFVWCLVHCVLYSLAVMIFTGWSLKVLPLVFLSHWIVDRYRWLGTVHIKFYGRPDGDTPIGLFVYIAMDNTIHLMFLWMINRFIL